MSDGCLPLPLKDPIRKNSDGLLNPDALPSFALYRQAGDQAGIGWELAPTPFALNASQLGELAKMGDLLWRFLQVFDQLYRDSLNQTAGKGIAVPPWVAQWLNQGKPQALLQLGQMKRLRNQMPLVIRPDLLLTDNGFALTEIDAVPGGIGFTSALNQAYRESGLSVVEPGGYEHGMPQAFLRMLLQAAPDVQEPTIAVVVSDEASDYRLELQWLVERIQAFYPHIELVHPKNLHLIRDQLVMTDASGSERPIDLIYRFFELFDLPNIPKIELVQYAIKKKIVVCTPPFKPHLEEKMMLALLHHPALAVYWQAHLGFEDFEALCRLIPPGWVVDPSPLPPHAVIPNLSPAGQAVQSFEQLFGLSQKERQLVLKPSGFSELAWGSRGVDIGHDLSSEEWREAIQKALNAFPKTPYLLQQFQNPKALPMERLVLPERTRQAFQAKVRLCPYYFILDGKPVLSGVLATACPADKKIIHGMRDAVLAPCGPAPLGG